LKKSGVASSWIDAISKAKAILGFSDRKEEPVKIKVAEPSPEQKAKVDEIIKEVEAEIGTKEIIEPKIIVTPEQPKILTNDVSKFDDPNFNIAELDMKVADIVKAEEIFTNDPATLDKEKEGDRMEHEEEKADDSLIMMNEDPEQPVENQEDISADSSEDSVPDEVEEAKDDVKMQNGDDHEGDSEDEDSTYTEEKEITKGKTLFDFE
jgi:hypothetical protein